MTSCCIICATHCTSNTPLATSWWERLYPILLLDSKTTSPPPQSAVLCDQCQVGVEQLIIVKSELERLEKELKTRVDNLRKQVAESQGRFVTRNLEDVRFRERIMGGYVVATNEPTCQQIYPSMPTLVAVQDYLQQPQEQFHVYQIPIFNSTPATVTVPQIFQEQVIRDNVYSEEEELGDYNEINDNDDDDNNDEDFDPEDGRSSPDPESSASSQEEEEENNSLPPTTTAPTTPATKTRLPRKRKKTNNENDNGGQPKRPRTIPTQFFSPFVKVANNQFTFEGYDITKLDTGHYQCTTCGWTENNKWNKGQNWVKVRRMKVHIYGAHLGNYKCTICDMLFKCDIGLKTHNAYFHPASDKPSLRIIRHCHICGKPTRRSDFQRHIWTHLNEEEKAAAATDQVPKKTHRKIPSNCQYCGRHFTFIVNRRRHERNSCPKKPNPTALVDSTSKEQLDQSSRRRFPIGNSQKGRQNIPCEVCGRVIKHSHFYASHLWTHKSKQEKEEATARGDVPKQTKLWQEYSKNSQCPVCGIFVFQTYLKKHLETHKDKKDRQLVQCEFAGCEVRISRDSYTRHVMRFHTPEKHAWHKCNVPGCNKRYFDGLTLQQHTLSSHRDPSTIEKNFLCDICNATFHKNGDLSQHKRVSHKGEKQNSDLYTHQCSLCPRKFLTEFTLQSHIGRCHREISKKALAASRPKHPHYRKRFPCPFCLCSLSAFGYEQHMSWLHKNVEELCVAVNAGNRIPLSLMNPKKQTLWPFAYLPKEKHQVPINCDLCPDNDNLKTVIELQQHILQNHPDLPQRVCNKKKAAVVVEPFKMLKGSEDDLQVVTVNGQIVARVGADGKFLCVSTT